MRKCLGAYLGDALAKADCFHVSRGVPFIHLPACLPRLGWPVRMSRAWAFSHKLDRPVKLILLVDLYLLGLALC